MVSNIESPTRCNNNNLLISKISSTCFWQFFTHHSVLFSRFSVLFPRLFRAFSSVVHCFFLGCKANARAILVKTWHGPHSSKIVVLYVLFVLYCSMYCLCVNVYCHRVTTQLQLTNINKYIISKYILSVSLIRLLCRGLKYKVIPPIRRMLSTSHKL